MNHTRTAFWVSEEQYQELNHLIIPAVQAGDSRAQAVHEELSIARTRFGASRLRNTRLARALGHKSDSVPLRLSDIERAYLLTFPLSPQLQGELT